MPIVQEQVGRESSSHAVELVFVDDAPPAALVNGKRALTFEQFLGEPASIKRVSIAIANPKVREMVAGRCKNHGLSDFVAKAANTVVMDEVQLGEGAILSPFTTLTSNIRIGRYFHCNLYSYVEHDCIIGDFVTFAPGVKCNGNVHIGDFAYLGAGAVLKQGRPGAPLKIGESAIVGMGAVVTKDVPAGATVVGNPARVVRMG
jgi:sugar O-acyltransferase (sialic acid O-acetyltransferase NeuD family)